MSKEDSKARFSTPFLHTPREALDIIAEHQAATLADVYLDGAAKLQGSITEFDDDKVFKGLTETLAGMASLRVPIDQSELVDLLSDEARAIGQALQAVDVWGDEGLGQEVYVKGFGYSNVADCVWVLYLTLLCARGVGDTNASKILALCLPGSCIMWDQKRIRAPWGLKSGPAGYVDYLSRGVEFGNRLIDYVADIRDVSRADAIDIIATPARDALTQRPRPMTKAVDDYAFRLPKYIQRTAFADRK